MYDSDEQRDRDIADLADGRRRPRSATGCWPARRSSNEAIAAIPDDQWETRIERTPGGRAMPCRARSPGMRLREVEIHHVDLGAGYTTRDWTRRPSPMHLLDAMTKRLDPPRARSRCGRSTSTAPGSSAPDGRRRRGRHRPGRRPRLVADRPPDARHPVLLARRAPDDRRMVTRDRRPTTTTPARSPPAASRSGVPRAPWRSPSSPSTRRCPTTATCCAAPTPATRC